MKYTAVCVLVVLLAVSTFGRNYQQEFADWMHEHQKSYDSQEFLKRFAIFKANVDFIDAHNTKNLTWTLAVNQFADLTGEEFKRFYTGLNLPTDRPTIRSLEEVSVEALPSSIDWVTKGAVTPVKNQGSCGSCWSFSATGAMEGHYFIQHSHLLSFSEQQLVDCSGSYGNQGCDGGLMDYAFAYVGTNGITTEAAYPYKGVEGTCKKPATVYLKGIGYHDVAQSVSALQTAVAAQPVSVAIEADQNAFQFYSSGVITTGCGSALDHGVLVVGYGTQSGQDYWKVKNSWGPSWGLQGYVLIGRSGTANGGAGVCGILSAASYPTGK